MCDATNICIDILNYIEMKYQGKSEYIAKRFQEKLDKWESKIEANKITSEYKEAYSEMSAKQLDESMKNIGYIENMNGNINFK